MSRHIILDWAFTVIGADKLKVLQDEGLVEGAIIRTCEGYGIDDELADHDGDGKPDHVVSRQVEEFDKVNMPYLMYQYVHAGLAADRQVSYFIERSVYKYGPGALVGDYEGYINYFVNPYRPYTAQELADGWSAHSEALEDMAYPCFIDTLNYSGPWVTEHSALLPAVWAKRWFWGAAYRYDWDWHTPSLWPKTWQAWRERIAALAFPVDPLYPSWGIWQFGGDVIPPGINKRVDVNICDNDQLFRGLFYHQDMPDVPGVIVPGPGVQYVVTATVLTVRKGAGTQYAKAPWTEWKLKGQEVSVLAEAAGWGRLADAGSEQRWLSLSGCRKV